MFGGTLMYLRWLYLVLAAVILGCSPDRQATPSLRIDWGHWRLGQKADLQFLAENRMTVTFGSGAPSFEYVTREEFDTRMAEAKISNQAYHDSGYIILKYLSTSLNGQTATNRDEPRKDQIDMLRFYRENWDDFADYLGPRPPEDPTTWITVRPDGSFPHYRYARYGEEPDEGFETWGCPHNPYYVRVMEGRVRAQAETGIDGSYVDWTHIAGGTCYCSYSQAAFRKYLLDYLPSKVAQAKYGPADYETVEAPHTKDDPFWMEWLQFRGYSVAEFHRRLRTEARRYNPDFMISGNVFGGFGYGPIALDAAGNMEMLAREGYDDFIYSEIQEFLDSAPGKRSSGQKITNSPALKFLAAAGHGKPAIVYATEITPPIFPDPSDQALSTMAQINIAEAVANHAIFREKRLTPEGATKMYRFLADNEEYLAGAQLHGNIAVLASLNQFIAGELSFAFSLSRVLADQGVAHVLLVEDDLKIEYLSRFDLVILPYIPLLSANQQREIQRFVSNGGNLLILGHCGVKDQYNLPQEKVILQELLDLTTYPPEETVAEVGLGLAAYMPLNIPPGRFLITQSAKEEVTTFGPDMADIFPDIPEGYTRGRMNPELRIVLERVATRAVELLDNRVSQILTRHPYLELTTMVPGTGNRLLAHLVNYNVTLDGTITPTRDIMLQLLLPPGMSASSVSYCGDLSALSSISHAATSTGKGQLLTISLNSLELYGLLVVEMYD